MKGKTLFIIFVLVICIFAVGTYWTNRINNTPYSDIRNQTISNINVEDNKFTIKGHMHTKLAVVTGYSSRVVGDAIYINIMMLIPLNSNLPKTWFFEKELPLTSNIGMIFIEDDKNKIMVWEKSQGYGEFYIEELWKTQLQELTELKKNLHISKALDGLGAE